MKKMNWLLLAILALSLPALAQEERLTPPPPGGFPEAPGSDQGKRIIASFRWVDPKGTYLKVTQPTDPNPPTIVSLEGIPAGTLLRMKQVGAFSSFPGQQDDVSVGLTGVFVNANGKKLSPGPNTTARDSNTDADIPEDFLLSLPFEVQPRAYTVEVPPGATELWFTPGNGYIYWDNDDPNENYGVLIGIADPLDPQTAVLTPSDSYNPSMQHYPNGVNVATGQMWRTQEDFVIPGRTPETALRMLRTYTGTRQFDFGHFGRNWHDAYETRLLPGGGGSRFDIEWIDETGGNYTFLIQPGNTYLPPLGTRFRLIDAGDHYELRKPGNTVLHFSKIPFGRLTKLVERHGEEMTFSYDGAGRLATVSSPMAGTITYFYNSRNLVAQVTRSRDNLFHTYEYNADDRLITVMDFNERAYHYTYVTNQPKTGAQDKLRTITDPIGRVHTFTYDRLGRTMTVVEPGNAKYSYAYAAHGGKLATSVRMPNGEGMLLYFDEGFHTTTEVFPDGARNIHTWDNGVLVATNQEHGGTTQYEYDVNKNVTGVKMPRDSSFFRVDYNLTFDQPTLITPLVGAATAFTLSPTNGDVMQVTRDGMSLAFTRDAFGNLLSTDNGRATYADVRNANGQITTKFDLRNPETRTYDSRNRLASREFLSGRVITYSYDSYDHVTSISDSHGPEVVLTYDDMERLISRSLTDGSTEQATRFTYDDQDRILTITDAHGRVTTFAYDPFKIRKKPSSITDPAGRTTSFLYDALDRLVEMTDAKGAQTRYTYDLRGNLTSVTDAKGQVTTYAYDANNRKTHETRPSARTENGVVAPTERVQTFHYDAGGRLKAEVMHSGNPSSQLGDRRTEYTYDGLDRVTQKVLSNGGAGGSLVEDDSSYTYEAQLDATLLKSAVNGVATLSFGNEAAPPFAISAFGVSASAPSNPFGLIQGDFAIVRDATGEIASVSKDGAPVFQKTYDPAGRLTEASAGGFSTNLTYDSFGRKSTVAHSSGGSGTFTYDLLNRITNIAWTGPTPVSETLTYDSQTGNITQIQREGGTYSIGYDVVDQITSAQGGAPNTPGHYDRSFTYDSLGNRLTDSGLGAGTFENNFLVRQGTKTYLADADGFGQTIRETPFSGPGKFSRMVRGKASSSTFDYAYRGDGLLALFSAAESYTQYFYDALGRRVAKRHLPIPADRESPISVESFLHLGDEDRILLAKATDESIVTYIDGQGVDEHLAEIRGSVKKGYVTDHLGSVLNGEAAGASKSFGVFGETKPTLAGPGARNPVTYGFTGREYDYESGLNYHRARMYDASVGRWLTMDPIGLQGDDLNYYRFVGNAPSIYTDPSGLRLQKLWLVGIQHTYLDDQFSPVVADFIGKASARGVDFRVTSAFRTTESQTRLLSDPTATTPAASGSSLHEAGWAIDINYRRLTAEQKETVKEVASELGLKWGGSFTKPDVVHFYVDPFTSLKARKKAVKRAQEEYENLRND